MIKTLFSKRIPGVRNGRSSDYLVTLGIFALVALIAVRLDGVETPALEGRAEVTDGDSIVIGGERVRLKGIDAPEIDQVCRKDGEAYDCGRSALAELDKLISGQTVSCSGRDRDRYGRLLGICSIGAIDLNLTMVRSGWAVSFGNYGAEESEAREAGRGLWAGEFDRPRAWRSAHGRMEEDLHDLFPTVRNWLRAFFGISPTGDPIQDVIKTR